MLRILLYTFGFVLLTNQPGYAYIDPGTGSFVTQVIAASIVGALVAVKTFWSNLKVFFMKIVNKHPNRNVNQFSENEKDTKN